MQHLNLVLHTVRSTRTQYLIDWRSILKSQMIHSTICSHERSLKPYDILSAWMSFSNVGPITSSTQVVCEDDNEDLFPGSTNIPWNFTLPECHNCITQHWLWTWHWFGERLVRHTYIQSEETQCWMWTKFAGLCVCVCVCVWFVMSGVVHKTLPNVCMWTNYTNRNALHSTWPPWAVR